MQSVSREQRVPAVPPSVAASVPASGHIQPALPQVQSRPGGRPTHAHCVMNTDPLGHAQEPATHIGAVTTSPH